MKMFCACCMSFLISYQKLHAASFISSQSDEEYKFILILLFFIVAFLFLISRNIQLKKTKESIKNQLIQQNSFSRIMIESAEKEHLRIVRTLHDNVGQQLSAAKLNISALQTYSKNANAADKIMIQKAVDLLDNSVKDVRNAAHSIIPNTLIKSGLISALVEMVNNFNTAGTLKINLDVVGNIDRFSRSNELILFKILRELITNCLKHSQATEINLQLIKHENELNILVQDNGVGFELKEVMKKVSCFGLKNIQAQVAFLNAYVFFDSQPGKGSTVTVEVPVD